MCSIVSASKISSPSKEINNPMCDNEGLRLPVVSAGVEQLSMGHLMRRNILAYKVPSSNEGYDLICTYPDPRHRPAPDELS